MIYTVTLNPALDYIMHVNRLDAADVNRSHFEDLHYGGKGINVSVMLTRLGVGTRALGFTAGFTGDMLEDLLKAENISTDFVRLKGGNTRINVKIKAQGEFDINARGPAVSDEEIKELLERIDGITEGDYLVLAGSVPENMPADIYERVLGCLENRGVRFAVDTTGELLFSTLKYKPFLIKPNLYEWGELFGAEIKTEKEAAEYARRLKDMGAANVLVSCGDKGALLLDENGGLYKVGSVAGKVANTVGCGDSMVAGFLAGYIETGDYSHALRLSAACGNATAFFEALADADAVNGIYDKLEVEKL